MERHCRLVWLCKSGLWAGETDKTYLLCQNSFVPKVQQSSLLEYLLSELKHTEGRPLPSGFRHIGMGEINLFIMVSWYIAMLSCSLGYNATSKTSWDGDVVQYLDGKEITSFFCRHIYKNALKASVPHTPMVSQKSIALICSQCGHKVMNWLLACDNAQLCILVLVRRTHVLP